MKIVLCKGRFAGPISGSDETLVAYAIQLKKAGHEVTVALLYPHAEDDPYYERLRDAGVPVSCVAQSSPLAQAIQRLRRRVPHLPAGPRKLAQKAALDVSMSYVEQCRKYFERCGAEVVHVLTPDPAAMAMIRGARAAGLRVLYHELGTPDFLPEMNLYYKHLEQVLPLCDGIAALSPYLASRFSETFPGLAPPSVLPLMVEDIAPVATPPAVEVTFGFAARMEYGKGPLSLLDAFARVYRRLGNVSLRMAGDGPQRSEVQSQARAAGFNGHCSFVGTYSGPLSRSAFMRSIDVLVLPSLAEGTPNSIVEAMAQGRPVIASAIGGIPDTVSPEAGVLVAAGDVDALAEAMTALASDAKRRAAMGEAARKRYEQIFSPAAVLPLLTNRYERVAGTLDPNSGRPPHPWSGA